MGLGGATPTPTHLDVDRLSMHCARLVAEEVRSLLSSGAPHAVRVRHLTPARASASPTAAECKRPTTADTSCRGRGGRHGNIFRIWLPPNCPLSATALHHRRRPRTPCCTPVAAGRIPLPPPRQFEGVDARLGRRLREWASSVPWTTTPNAWLPNVLVSAACTTLPRRRLRLLNGSKPFAIEFVAGPTLLALVVSDLLGPWRALVPRVATPTLLPRRRTPPARWPGTRRRGSTRCRTELAGGPL